MANYPVLKSGAYVQYPFTQVERRHTAIVRFVDGSEQRFPERKDPLNRWILPYRLLTDAEIRAHREFLDAQQGANAFFTFTDPVTTTVYTHSVLEGTEFLQDHVEGNRHQTTVTIETEVLP